MMRSEDFGFGSGSGVLQRFHFDLENGDEVIEDHEGIGASSLEEAATQARTVISEMRDNNELAEPGMWTLAIREAGGAVLKRLSVE